MTREERTDFLESVAGALFGAMANRDEDHQKDADCLPSPRVSYVAASIIGSGLSRSDALDVNNGPGWHRDDGGGGAFTLTAGELAEAMRAAGIPHDQDEHCTVDPSTDCCSVCGVHHVEPCVWCYGRAFHRPGCIVLALENSVPGDSFDWSLDCGCTHRVSREDSGWSVDGEELVKVFGEALEAATVCSCDVYGDN